MITSIAFLIKNLKIKNKNSKINSQMTLIKNIEKFK